MTATVLCRPEFLKTVNHIPFPNPAPTQLPKDHAHPFYHRKQQASMSPFQMHVSIYDELMTCFWDCLTRNPLTETYRLFFFFS